MGRLEDVGLAGRTMTSYDLRPSFFDVEGDTPAEVGAAGATVAVCHPQSQKKQGIKDEVHKRGKLKARLGNHLIA